jgi:hypothetical protein
MNQLDELPAVKPVEIFTRNNNEESQLGKETAARFDSGKPRYDLIPPYALHELVLVFAGLRRQIA